MGCVVVWEGVGEGLRQALTFCFQALHEINRNTTNKKNGSFVSFVQSFVVVVEERRGRSIILLRG